LENAIFLPWTKHLFTAVAMVEYAIQTNWCWKANGSFVDGSCFAAHIDSQPSTCTAQLLVTTHKGGAMTTFHQIALLGKGNSGYFALRWLLQASCSMITINPEDLVGRKLIRDF
jgi:hypothetical protein